MIVLPETPMKPRRYDDRVGFFRVSFQDYGSPKQEVDRVSYITRWRLELSHRWIPKLLPGPGLEP
jgi:hypothetical protein